ncbi:MAG: heparinase II/III family protein [Candidatus Hydrogenedentes bacterium]|nr:heparinase II/III family protein [Candidatus Hydrogenedentota bacterium]
MQNRSQYPRLTTLSLLASTLSILSTAFAATNEATVLNTLTPNHPRLILLNDGLAKLKAAYETDTTLQRYAAEVKEQADKALSAPPLEHKLIGPRLLQVSRACLDRIYPLALAWRWTGEKQYADAVEANLLTVCAFPDWNPPHFLDTAEMTHAVAVGYDWIYDALSEGSRAKIRTALIEKGLKPGIAIYDKGGWWTESEFNWNQVCNAGMLIGALAIAETDPQYAQSIIPRAVASLPKALRAYDPDGAWMEGPGYWSYATRYTAYGICALDTALGTDFGLSDMPGLRVTGHFPNYTTGPTGLFLNYADSGERSKRRPMPCMFWLAQKYNDSVISDAEHAVLAHGRASAEHLVWYVAPTGKEAAAPDLERWFRSPVDIIVMRSAWNDPNALFVGVKGGYNQVNHGHLDLGNFELDALGVRWARDLGSDDYNLPGYWDKKKGGKRWQYYRLNSASHNVPMINGKNQDENATAKILDMSGAKDIRSVSIDLTSAYPEFSDKTTRRVALYLGSRFVQIRDEFNILKPCEIAWGMTTDAMIEIQDNGAALLTLDGKQLEAKIHKPEGASFTAESAERPTPEKTNIGIQRLITRVKVDQPGPVNITILLAPVWPE